LLHTTLRLLDAKFLRHYQRRMQGKAKRKDVRNLPLECLPREISGLLQTRSTNSVISAAVYLRGNGISFVHSHASHAILLSVLCLPDSCTLYAASFQVLHFNDVGHLGLLDLDGYGRETFAYLTDPFMAGQRGEGLRHGFVQRTGRQVEGVGHLVQVLDRDGAATKRSHDSNLSYSLFVRLCKASLVKMSYIFA